MYLGFDLTLPTFSFVAFADDGEAHISDFTPGEKTLIGLLLPYMKSGCDGKFQRTVFTSNV